MPDLLLADRCSVPTLAPQRLAHCQPGGRDDCIAGHSTRQLDVEASKAPISRHTACLVLLREFSRYARGELDMVRGPRGRTAAGSTGTHEAPAVDAAEAPVPAQGNAGRTPCTPDNLYNDALSFTNSPISRIGLIGTSRGDPHVDPMVVLLRRRIASEVSPRLPAAGTLNCGTSRLCTRRTSRTRLKRMPTMSPHSCRAAA